MPDNSGQGSPTTPQPSQPVQPEIQPAARRRRWPVIIIGAIVGLLVLGSVSAVGASWLEEHDSFCGVCHTAPETTYISRTSNAVSDLGAPIVDLASYHYHQAQAKAQGFNCISCHRGDSSIDERAATLALGARDTLIFISGKGDMTLEKRTITQPELPNAGCISCHTATLLTQRGIQNHFHTFLPQAQQLIASGSQWITPTPTNGGGVGGFGGEGRRFQQARTINTTVTCTSCHLAHETVTNGGQYMYVDPTYAQPACDSCHKAASERPQSFNSLNRERG